MSRRQFLKKAAILGLSATGLLSLLEFLAPKQRSPPETPENEVSENLLVPILPQDGKPALNDPSYATMREADRVLQDDDVVFGLDHVGFRRALPKKIMNYHEVLNQRLDAEVICVSWCPLTGSAIAFQGKSEIDRTWLSFGVSGRLFKSNLVMYDHQTKSLWPQLAGRAVSGPSKGKTLLEIPLFHTTWGKWKRRFPDTLALSHNTGYGYPYEVDIYKGYEEISEVQFTSFEDKRFHPKKTVAGIKINDDRLAVLKEEFKSIRLTNALLGGIPILVLYDNALDSICAFKRNQADVVLTFRQKQDSIVDDETSSEWNLRGEALSGPLTGRRLERLSSVDVYWFAWLAFNPRTKVFP